MDFSLGEVMAVALKWRQHIESLQSCGLSQAEYCAQQRINVRTFTTRLSDSRKQPAVDSVALVPVRFEKTERDSIATAIQSFFGHPCLHLHFPFSQGNGWTCTSLLTTMPVAPGLCSRFIQACYVYSNR